MRILQIFNPYVKFGGEEEAVNQISVELGKSHTLRNISFDVHRWAEGNSLLKPLKQFALMAWNPASVRLVRDTIAEFQPDVIILHNLMPVGSAALYDFLSRCGVPLVHYIHNFRPFSVNGYCWGKGKILSDGLNLNFFPEILAGSWQGSRVKTAWYALLLWILHKRGVYRSVQGWIAISHFMKETFVKGGIDEQRIAVIPHSWTSKEQAAVASEASDSPEEPLFLFLGRITEEKGVRVLLDAWDVHEQSGGKGTLVIGGDGPLVTEVSERCEKLAHARYAGFCAGAQKEELLRDCKALIVPSVWWEPLGLVLYEAYDHGKPVLAAASGGILDHVTDGVTGWIHEPGNVAQLAAHIREVSENPQEAALRGSNGRERVAQLNPHRWIRDLNAFLHTVTTRPEVGALPGIEKAPALRVQVYLADQNPGYDRSFGISRMSRLVLEALQKKGGIQIDTVVSKTSHRGPENVSVNRSFPWGTRNKVVRFLTDHFHPLIPSRTVAPDIFYYPKGFLPFLSFLSRPSVVTIHDTIIQFDEDHFPDWRSRWEYCYWEMMLKHTLRRADRILTVSESSKKQILAFMERHRLPSKEIAVTYEPCMYESIPQPECPIKKNFVIHLASCEPHKMTSHLIRWWHEAEKEGRDLPMLHLIGSVPSEVSALLASSRSIVKRPFLEDEVLQVAYLEAKALILPSAIEGFGLPALEAYYLGTPVCYVKGTSVEEVLGVATSKGGFALDDPQSLFDALDEVIAMDAAEVKACGLVLRDTYAAAKVAERMMAVFQTLQESR